MLYITKRTNPITNTALSALIYRCYITSRRSFLAEAVQYVLGFLLVQRQVYDEFRFYLAEVHKAVSYKDGSSSVLYVYVVAV